MHPHHRSSGASTGSETAPPTDSIDRRTIIRKAVGTGFVAWSAPVIVQSFASPAAALTVTTGCFVFAYQIDATGLGTWAATYPYAPVTATPAPCAPAGCATAPAQTATTDGDRTAIGLTGVGPGSLTGQITFTIPATNACQVENVVAQIRNTQSNANVRANAAATPQNDFTVVGTLPGKSVTISLKNNRAWIAGGYVLVTVRCT